MTIDYMEDFILREIDRIGELLMQVARRLGLLRGDAPDYTIADVKEEFATAGVPIDLDSILKQENPVWYLVHEANLTDQGLETFIDIVYHSDVDDAVKEALLDDALAYLEGKGSFSIKLFSLKSR